MIWENNLKKVFWHKNSVSFIGENSNLRFTQIGLALLGENPFKH